MSKLKRLSLLQMNFVRAYLSDGCTNVKAAVREAGYAESSANKQAYLLMRNPLVVAQIEKHNKKLDKKAILTANQTLEKLSRIASGEKNAFARLKALEMLAKYHGLMVDRSEIGKPGDFDKLTDDQVEQEIKALLERRPESGLVM